MTTTNNDAITRKAKIKDTVLCESSQNPRIGKLALPVTGDIGPEGVSLHTLHRGAEGNDCSLWMPCSHEGTREFIIHCERVNKRKSKREFRQLKIKSKCHLCSLYSR